MAGRFLTFYSSKHGRLSMTDGAENVDGTCGSMLYSIYPKVLHKLDGSSPAPPWFHWKNYSLKFSNMVLGYWLSNKYP